MGIFILALPETSTIIRTIKLFFILLFSAYIFIKIYNIDIAKKKIIPIGISAILIISIIDIFIKYTATEYFGLIFQILAMSILNYILFRKELANTIIITILSISINYVISIISILIALVPTVVLNISSDTINLILILLIQAFLTSKILKIKKIKYGINFLKQKLDNGLLSMFILNISSIVLYFYSIMISEFEGKLVIDSLVNCLVIGIIITITISKCMQLFYKHNLMTKELEIAKQEINDKNKKIEELENENLEISKTRHSLIHKQKALEYKLNQLLQSSEIGKELDIKDKIEEVSKELYNRQEPMELAKTGINLIDNILGCMQKECIENKIDFELQLCGNINYMTNHLITEEDLEILLADHIKDAIIAVNHSDNEHRSILVKLGRYDDVYGLYIYDSGIKFEQQTLENLGKRPSTTHKEEGGTGLGFMNTFDTLKRTNASLIIEQFNNVTPEEYTKVITIKFDGKKEFTII